LAIDYLPNAVEEEAVRIAAEAKATAKAAEGMKTVHGLLFTHVFIL
jgi:hypothetical protein